MMANKIRSYTELRALVRASLRLQHPEWIQPNGESPICDEYEARLTYLLGLSEDGRRRRTANRESAA
jgi:hypothetical protein